MQQEEGECVMGFKIGDRVRIVSGEDIRGEGAVGTLASVLLKDYDWRVDLADEDWVPVYSHEIQPADAPVIKRSPKPLTLTGGHPRFTVRQGQQLVRVRVTAPVSNVRVAFIAVR